MSADPRGPIAGSTWRGFDVRAIVAQMNVIRSLARVMGCVALSAVLLSSCASIRFERTSPNSGTFKSSAVAFTILSFDIPSPAQSIARANAADSGRSELIVEHERVFPYLGWFDWLLDIIGVRWATISGTWGEPAGIEDER